MAATRFGRALSEGWRVDELIGSWGLWVCRPAARGVSLLPAWIECDPPNQSLRPELFSWIALIICRNLTRFTALSI